MIQLTLTLKKSLTVESLAHDETTGHQRNAQKTPLSPVPVLQRTRNEARLAIKRTHVLEFPFCDTCA